MVQSVDPVLSPGFNFTAGYPYPYPYPDVDRNETKAALPLRMRNLNWLLSITSSKTEQNEKWSVCQLSKGEKDAL